MGEPVGPPEAELIHRLDALGREPGRTLPAEPLAEHGALGLVPLVERIGPGRTAGGPFLVGIGYEVHAMIGLEGLGDVIVLGGVWPEAAGVELQHVDLRLSLDHPLGQVLAAAAALGDADAGPTGKPEIVQPEGRAQQHTAVRGVGDRTVDDFLDAGRLQNRHAFHSHLDEGLDPVEVGRQQFLVEVGGYPVDSPGLGAPGLVGPEIQAVLFLAQVKRRVRVADHGKQAPEGLDLGDALGHQILVLHHDDGQGQPHHGADFDGEGAGGVDHDFGRDGPLVRRHRPFAVGLLRKTRDPGVAVDLGAAHARALGHGLGCARRVDKAVRRGVGAADHVIEREEGMEGLDFIGADYLERQVEVARLGAQLLELVHAVPGRRQPDAAVLVEAGGLAGLGLEPLVKVGAVRLHLGHIEADFEMGRVARRVPGRARGQLALLHQHHVRPTQLGQVIKQAAAEDAAADHHHARMRLHGPVSLLWVSCSLRFLLRSRLEHSSIPGAAEYQKPPVIYHPSLPG